MQELIGLDKQAFVRTLSFFEDLGLVSQQEIHETLALFDAGFPFAEAVRAAESIHLHIKVADTTKLPHDTIRGQGVEPTSCTEGYIKYPFPGGINMIFSSIPISEDDMLAGAPTSGLPRLDHKGIDLRRVTPESRALFDAVPSVATARGWRHRGQGGAGTPGTAAIPRWRRSTGFTQISTRPTNPDR